MIGQKITVADAGRFAFAGDAIFTMVRPARFLQDGSTDPEKRITYRIQRAKNKSEEEEPDRPWFVKVLSGPDNVRDYQYLGTIFPKGEGVAYYHGKKSHVGENADSAKGIAWFVRHINRLIELKGELANADLFSKAGIDAEIAKVEGTLNKLNYYHEGRCGACAKRLTVPESIINGIGPKCAQKFGVPGILERLARI